MKKIKTLFILTSIFVVITSLAFSNQSTIFNFSSKKIYYSVQNPSQYGKIPSFKQRSIYFNRKTAPVQIYTTSEVHIKTCLFKVYEKEDVFVTDNGRSIKCKLRAERLPKEF